jgi:hypothetical protein
MDEQIFRLYKSDLRAGMGKIPKCRYNEPPKGLEKKKKAKRRMQKASRRK